MTPVEHAEQSIRKLNEAAEEPHNEEGFLRIMDRFVGATTATIHLLKHTKGMSQRGEVLQRWLAIQVAVYGDLHRRFKDLYGDDH